MRRQQRLEGLLAEDDEDDEDDDSDMEVYYVR
jgi:GTP-binding protein